VSDPLLYTPHGCVLYLDLRKPDSGYLRDYSGHGNHGIIHGARLEQRHPLWGLSFDGVDDYVEVPAMNIDAKSITVIALARSATPVWNTNGWIASSRGASGFIIHPRENLKAWTGYVINDAGYYYKIGEHTPEDIRRFHMYCITFDHDTKVARMYFDGVIVAENVINITRGVWNHHTLIGKDDYPDRYGHGHILLIQIYNRALTAEEIKRCFESIQQRILRRVVGHVL